MALELGAAQLASLQPEFLAHGFQTGAAGHWGQGWKEVNHFRVGRSLDVSKKVGQSIRLQTSFLGGRHFASSHINRGRAAAGEALNPRKETRWPCLQVHAIAEPPSKEVPANLMPLVSTAEQRQMNDVPISQTLHPLDGEDWRTLPGMWRDVAQRHADRVAVFEPHRDPPVEITYHELNERIQDFAEGLQVFGLQKGDCVALFSDNSHRWLIADQGVIASGACDAVRGAKSSISELVHILCHSESTAVIVDTEELLQKLVEAVPSSASSPSLAIKFAVVLWPSSTERRNSMADASAVPFPVLAFEEILEAGNASRDAHAAAGAVDRRPAIRPDDVATLVYTSGTSGNPKAVMLTHTNLMHQIRSFRPAIATSPGDVMLSLLPPWHMYERSCEYFILSAGLKLTYSSVKTFKEDLPRYPPEVFVAVPLVFEVLHSNIMKKIQSGSAAKAAVALWLMSVSQQFMDAMRIIKGMDLSKARQPQSFGKSVSEFMLAGLTALLLFPMHKLAGKIVYSKIRAAIGIKKTAISGGGSLPPHVDRFFEMIGINLRNGYGLTETSPVLTVRMEDNNVLGTVGVPLGETEIKIVDLESRKELPPGERGLVKARGPQVMKGYFKNPMATSAAIDDDGWFDTGDLGWIVPQSSFGGSRNCGGHLVLDGRAKDTIVLANGENVEPTKIEEDALKSEFIHQIMVVGQDKRRLGALIVPRFEELDKVVAKRFGIDVSSVTDDQRKQFLNKDLRKHHDEAGALAHERIGPFVLLHEPFLVENGQLTPTMKMRREVILQKHKSEYEALYRHD